MPRRACVLPLCPIVHLIVVAAAYVYVCIWLVHHRSLCSCGCMAWFANLLAENMLLTMLQNSHRFGFATPRAFCNRILVLLTFQMVYNMFCMSAVMASFCRAPPVYSYFINIWNRDCSNIKLKKAMRFTKCDVCTLANEALDVQRRKGGMGWMTEEMEKIKKHLEDHYEVHVSIKRTSSYLVGEHSAVRLLQACTTHPLTTREPISPRSLSCCVTMKTLVLPAAPYLRHVFFGVDLSGRQTIESSVHDGQDACLHQSISSALYCHRRR